MRIILSDNPEKRIEGINAIAGRERAAIIFPTDDDVRAYYADAENIRTYSGSDWDWIPPVFSVEYLVENGYDSNNVLCDMDGEPIEKFIIDDVEGFVREAMQVLGVGGDVIYTTVNDTGNAYFLSEPKENVAAPSGIPTAEQVAEIVNSTPQVIKE